MVSMLSGRVSLDSLGPSLIHRVSIPHQKQFGHSVHRLSIRWRAVFVATYYPLQNSGVFVGLEKNIGHSLGLAARSSWSQSEYVLCGCCFRAFNQPRDGRRRQGRIQCQTAALILLIVTHHSLNMSHITARPSKYPNMNPAISVFQLNRATSRTAGSYLG